MVIKHISKFGGINFEKYKTIYKNQKQYTFDYMPNPIEGFVEHYNLVLDLEYLNKEDFNRLTNAFFEGAFELINCNEDSFVEIMNQYFENEGNNERMEMIQSAIKEAIPKFKADLRYDPKWKYDPSVKNDEEIIYDLDEVVRLRELKEGKESKE